MTTNPILRATETVGAVSRPGGARQPEPAVQPPAPTVADQPARPTEHGGPKGPEPTRYGDWERNGRCSDF